MTCGWCGRVARPPKCTYCGTTIFSGTSTAPLGHARGVIVRIDRDRGWALAEYRGDHRAFIGVEQVTRLALKIGDQVEFDARPDVRGRGVWAAHIVRVDDVVKS
jgi:hypothetical protein